MNTELAIYLINGLLFLLTASIGYIVRDVISQVKDLKSKVEENSLSITKNNQEIIANSEKDSYMNAHTDKGIEDLKVIMVSVKSDILESLKKYEDTSTKRLDSHSAEIKDLNKRIVKLESQ